MSRYPDDMTRVWIQVDLNGSLHDLSYDVPPAWVGWTDDERRTWTRERSHGAVWDLVSVVWSAGDPDAADEWADRWSGHTGDLV